MRPRCAPAPRRNQIGGETLRRHRGGGGRLGGHAEPDAQRVWCVSDELGAEHAGRDERADASARRTQGSERRFRRAPVPARGPVPRAAQARRVPCCAAKEACRGRTRLPYCASGPVLAVSHLVLTHWVSSKEMRKVMFTLNVSRPRGRLKPSQHRSPLG